MGSSEVEWWTEESVRSCSSVMVQSSPLDGGIGIVSSGECGTGLMADGRLGYTILSLVFLEKSSILVMQK